MKCTSLLFLLWVSLFNCQKDSPDPATCQVQNPLTDLLWLKAIVDGQHISLQVEQGLYHKHTVYIITTCIQCFAGGIATIYRCDGTEICHFGTYVLEPNPSCKEIAEKDITDKRVLLSR